MKCGKSYKLEV